MEGVSDLPWNLLPSLNEQGELLSPTEGLTSSVFIYEPSRVCARRRNQDRKCAIFAAGTVKALNALSEKEKSRYFKCSRRCNGYARQDTSGPG